MSEYGQRQRPAVEPADKPAQHDDPRFVGGGVAADRAWAQNRIRNYFAGNRSVIQRKPKTGDPQTDHKTEQGNERAKKTVDHADQPLEPGGNAHVNQAQHGHGHSEHGYQTTMDQQKRRVETGQTPSGGTHKADGTPNNKPGKASRFFSPAHEAEALARGKAQLQKDIDAHIPTCSPPTRPDGSPQRHEVIVPTDRREGYGERAVKVSNNPRTAQADNTALRHAFVLFEYVASLGAGDKAAHWRPVTYYPVE